jgi:hypothetical protein
VPARRSSQRGFTHKGTKEDVDEADEHLGNEHSLPEIPWVTHLSQEGDEE